MPGALKLLEKKVKVKLPFFGSLRDILLRDIKYSFSLPIVLHGEAAQVSKNLPILGVAPRPVWEKSDIA